MGVPPILTIRRPLITDDSSALNDDIGNGPKGPEEASELSPKPPQPAQSPNVSRFIVDTFIDVLPGRTARAGYRCPEEQMLPLEPFYVIQGLFKPIIGCHIIFFRVANYTHTGIGKEFGIADFAVLTAAVF